MQGHKLIYISNLKNGFIIEPVKGDDEETIPNAVMAAGKNDKERIINLLKAICDEFGFELSDTVIVYEK
jgi:hypothetical protein